jgi:signal transduction histidine kinase
MPDRLWEDKTLVCHLMESLPDLVLVVERGGAIRFVNHGVGGATVEQILAAEPFAMLAPAHRQACQAGIVAALDTGHAQTVDVLDIFDLWWSLQILPILPAGEVPCVVAVGTNVTEWRSAAEGLQKERQLLRQWLDLQERDRRRASHQIHEGLAQPLFGAMLQFEGFREAHGRDTAAAWRMFDTALHLLCGVVDQSRRLISALRPPILDESGIIAAVEYLVMESGGDPSPAIEFVHDVRFKRLAAPVEGCLFRILSEGLQNAIRHSRSPRICIEIRQDDQVLRLGVRDWGVGFDPHAAHEDRFGLQGIRERVQLLGGQVAIETGPNRGTHLLVEVPWNEAFLSPGRPRRRRPQ